MNATEDFVQFLVKEIPAKSLAEFKPSEEARKRIWRLVEKEKEVGLLPEEKLELDDYERLEHLVLMAKAKASGLSHG